jgi:hypothetical protein
LIKFVFVKQIKPTQLKAAAETNKHGDEFINSEIRWGI